MEDGLYDGGMSSTAGQSQEAEPGLYEGLFARSTQAASGDTYLQHKVNELEELLKEKTAEAASLRNKLNSRDQQIYNLTAERDTLLRNISVLFNTAKGEMARKLAEIAQLRVELNGWQPSLPSTSGQGTRQLLSVPPRTGLPPLANQSADAGRHAQQQQQRDRLGASLGRWHADGSQGSGSASAFGKRGRDGSLEPERDGGMRPPETMPRGSSGGGGYGAGSGEHRSGGSGYASGGGGHGGGGGYGPLDDTTAKRQRYGGPTGPHGPHSVMPPAPQPPQYQPPQYPHARHY